MSVRVQQVNPAGIKTYFGTLTDGVLIHDAFHELALQHKIGAGTFTLLGGLTGVEFTEFNFITHTRNEPLQFDRPLEIVGGNGTISALDEKPHIHLHLILSFQDSEAPNGVHIIAGHVSVAKCFAVEFVLNAYGGNPVKREMDPVTGLKLWDLPDVIE